METIFLNVAGMVQFVRDDMEQGNWTQEEYTVNATFPYVEGKVIVRGMRMAFRDPATNTLEMFEVRNVTNIEPDHYQQIIAEHIAVSELSDEHINTTEITDKTAAQALATALTGTLWSVGNDTSSGTSSVNIARGSVWQAVNSIMSNWNVYITPRVATNAAGSITGRYLDIAPAQGVWRGVRLSIDKNMSDSSVVYDDSEVLTALYGYGGNVDKAQTSGADKQEELTFKDVVWTATSAHPAKPANQTYLEWPEKTVLYGRNGRPRYGYYQNGDIKDASILLQKTWEALQKTCAPKISITGTVSDLYRLGYKDQPLRLHDTVIIEIRQTGEKFEKEIIKLDVDLIDPTASRPEIGDYIPNIIYINEETSKRASGGGGGGGGGGRGMTKLEDEQAKTYTDWLRTDNLIGLVAGYYNGTAKIETGRICLAINEDTGEGTAIINANHVNISSTNTAHLLSGSIVYDEDGNLVLKESTGGGVYVEHNDQGTTAQFGVWDKGNLTGLTVAQLVNGETSAYLNADHVNISGTSTVQTIAGAMERDSSGHLVIKEGAGLYAEHTVSGSTAKFGVFDNHNLTGGVVVQKINGQTGTVTKITGSVVDVDSLVTTINSSNVEINAERTTIASYLAANTVTMGSLTVTNLTELHNVDCQNVDCSGLSTNTGDLYCGGTATFNDDFTFRSQAVTWKSYTARLCSLSNNYVFKDNDGTTHTGALVIAHTDTTIHYLGY